MTCACYGQLQKHTPHVCSHGVCQVKSELTAVEKAEMNGQPIEDSFARVGYAKDAEYAVNEQIKYEPVHICFRCFAETDMILAYITCCFGLLLYMSCWNHATAIPSRTYPFSSDQGSQTGLGSTSLTGTKTSLP